MKEQLFRPMPVAYERYTANEALTETEAYFEKIHELQDRMKEKGNAYKQRLDALIHKKASAVEIGALILEEDYQTLCVADGDLDVITTLVGIAIKEEQVGHTSILHAASSIGDAIEIFQRILFGIRRIALCWEEEANSEFLELVKEYDISYICLAEGIKHKTMVNQISTACSLAKCLAGVDRTLEALKLIILLDGVLDYSEEKIVEFTDAYLQMGAIKAAYEEILKYRNPNREILQLTEQLSAYCN